MGVEPLLREAVRAGGDGRDLVFLSYSHDDAQWAQRIGVLLKPLLRRERLRLWVDTDLRAGDAWQSEIMRGITRSRVALLLVSADFLASDFIMDTELPMLIAHGVRLAPVLVGDCFWREVPELVRVQWLHDPGRDGALSLVGTDGGRRDQRLLQVCEKLLEKVLEAALLEPAADIAPAEPDGAVGEDAVPTPDVVAVPEAPAGSAPGALIEVPVLPPGYVLRDELAGLIEAVVGVAGGAVGLTGDVTAVGVHGQGGIGKSVLAAALARDEGIGRRFPDGVFWVTVGERPDVLALQLRLLARLGAGGGQAPRTVTEAAAALTELVATRRLLLVVDDVWSVDAARAFRVTGPHGRVVYTSRDPAVLAGAGAHAHQVEVLSPAAARGLAAGVLGVTVRELPELADQVLARVGGVALGVALLAAAVRGGRSWAQLAADLDRDGTVFGTHPYANTFKAMQVAVDALPAALASALLSLAVFPPDTQIPIAAIARYWTHTRGCSVAETVADLDRLDAAKVVQRDGDQVGFHDLQHDYLLLHAPLLSDLHTALLGAYRTLLSADPGSWWHLPVAEPYIWDHLIAHLRGAGDHAEMSVTVTDPAYVARRIITAGGTHAAEADLALAADALPADPKIGWWQRWITRHSHLLIPPDPSTDGQPDTLIATTMLAWLTADPTHRDPDINPDRLTQLLPNQYLQLRWGLTTPPTALIRVLTGHTGGVRAVAWSPDETRLASAGDSTVRVWDAASGASQATLTGHTDWVRAVAWSPDGTRLASAGDDKAVRVWDAASGAPQATLTGHTDWVRAVAWSPDGTRLASASGDSTVRVWDAASGAPQATLTGHTSGVWAVAWSPDGTRLASASADKTVRVWDPTMSRRWWRRYLGLRSVKLTGHTDWVRAVAWSPDGTRLASAGNDSTVRVWDAASGAPQATLTGHTDWVRAVAWSPDGTRLASAGDDKAVRVWDAASGAPQATLTGHTDWVSAVAWAPDSTRLATASADLISIRDVAHGEVQAQLRLGQLTDVAWGTAVAAAGVDGVVVLDLRSPHATLQRLT